MDRHPPRSANGNGDSSKPTDRPRGPGRPVIEVDADSPVPPYEQIRSQLVDLIESGAMPAGTKLPPIRQLAADLDLAPGTVARAYRALDDAGLVTGRARTGTTVTTRPRPTAAQAQRQLDRAARSYAATVRALGLSHEQAIAALTREASRLPSV